jgi:L-fuconolactonase
MVRYPRQNAGDPAFTPIQRSFGPADLQPELQAAGVFASVTVQAADSSEENDILLAHAAQTPWIAGVVGWIPLDRPDEAALMLPGWMQAKVTAGPLATLLAM